MKGRNIAQNVYTMTNITDHCKKNKIPAVIMSIDFQKAFETIEWTAIEKVLKCLNFGNYFISAVMTLYNE